MTNHPRDFQNTDVALVIGSNLAENHPLAMRWVQKARETRGAKLIHVDPRFTRTSALADLYGSIRPGTDIAFIGGLINYAISNNRIHEEYVAYFTNASLLIDEGFKFEDGLFSGYDPAKMTYNKASWAYQTDKEGNLARDYTLQHPRSVFQLITEHYSRYTPEKVSAITGIPEERFLEIADLFTSTYEPTKTGAIMYAMGTTQHTVGSQNVRSYAVLQLLLGNIGRPGGGVNAMRGHSNVQGSTDVALLQNILPGYLNTPIDKDHPTFAVYNEKETPAGGYWTNKPKFLVSLLKAWWGGAARADNDYAYDYLPKRAAATNYTHMFCFDAAAAGTIKGMYVVGQNTVIDGPNSTMETKALENLEWLVVSDIFETETATFWRRPGADPASIKTEVFLLPAASFLEKDGTVTNTGRVLQWRDKAVEPRGNSKSDAWIVNQLALRLKKLYAASDKEQDKPIKYLLWNYGDGEPDSFEVLKEINGYDVKTNEPLPSFGLLKDDGSTASGCWIYTGAVTPAGNMTARRSRKDPGGVGNFPEWGFAWPANRRILYNRSSADTNGLPWNKDKANIWWDRTKGQWVGYDVPDFGVATNPASAAGSKAFIMQAEGVARLFAPGLADGPFPEHYEPFESPAENPFSSQQTNPTVPAHKSSIDKYGKPDQFPIVASTWRLSEHMGGGTRHMPWLAEAQPDHFVEISETLAEAQGIKTGDRIKVRSARAEIESYALVTKRIRPLDINGRTVEQVGMSWHFGYEGAVKGAIANALTPHIGDPNTSIPEYKAFLVDVEKVVM